MSDIEERTPQRADLPQEPSLPPDLRLLKGLVTALTVTMIGGLLVVIGLLVTRLPKAAPPAPLLPAAVTLPAGARAEAVTVGPGWVIVVTDQGEALVYDATTGALRQTLPLAAP